MRHQDNLLRMPARFSRRIVLFILMVAATLASGCQSSCPTWANSLGATDHPRYPSSRFATWVGVAESETEARVKAIQGVSSQLKVEFSAATLRRATYGSSGRVELTGSSRADMRTGNLVIRYLRLTQTRCASVDYDGARAHYILAAFDRGEVHREARKQARFARPALREKLKAISEASDPQRTHGNLHVICAPGGRLKITSSDAKAQLAAEIQEFNDARQPLLLPPAQYNVWCSAAGFQSQLERVRVRPRATANVHFTLEPNDELHYVGEDLAKLERHIAPRPIFTVSPAVPHFSAAKVRHAGVDGAGIEFVRLTLRWAPESETTARVGFEGSIAPGLTFSDEAAFRAWLHLGPWFRPFSGSRGATFELNPRAAASVGDWVSDSDLEDSLLVSNTFSQPGDEFRLPPRYLTVEGIAHFRPRRWLRLSAGYGWLWAWSNLGLWTETSDGRYRQDVVEDSFADHGLYARVEFDGRLDSFPSRLVPMSVYFEARATLGAFSGDRPNLVDASAGLAFQIPPGPEGL